MYNQESITIEFYEGSGYSYAAGLLSQQFHIIVRLILINYEGNFADRISSKMKSLLDLGTLISKSYLKIFPLMPSQKLEDLSSELSVCTHNRDGNTYKNKISPNKSSFYSWINLKNALILIVLVILILGIVIVWKNHNGVRRIYNGVRRRYKLLPILFSQETIRPDETEMPERSRTSTTNSSDANPSLHITSIAERLKKELASEIIVNKLYLDLEYEFTMNGLKFVGLQESARCLVKVYTHELSKFSMAIKFLRIVHNQFDETENSRRIKKLKDEIINLKKISPCPNVVDLYGICFHEGEILICMELMHLSFKELYLIVQQKSKKTSEKIIGYVTVSILKALIFCKGFNIIHRDIKPSNILLNQRGEIKLCDFGDSKFLENSQVNSRAGTVAYWPPENFTNPSTKYDNRCDVWSLGITLIEAILCRLPYLRHTDKSTDNYQFISEKIVSTKFSQVINDKIHGRYSDELAGFLKLCLENLEARPNVEQLIKAPFYLNFEQLCTPENISEEITEILST